MGNQHTCMARVDEAYLNWDMQTTGPGVMTGDESEVPVKAASGEPRKPSRIPSVAALWSPAPFARLFHSLLGLGDQEQQRLKGPCLASRPPLMSGLERNQVATSQRFTPRPAAQTMQWSVQRCNRSLTLGLKE